MLKPVAEGCGEMTMPLDLEVLAKRRHKKARPPQALSATPILDPEARAERRAITKAWMKRQRAAKFPTERDYVRLTALRDGPLPLTGVIGDEFWSGYRHDPCPVRGLTGSIERLAYDAGWNRAIAEPGLAVVKHQPLDKTMLSEAEWIKANG